MKRTDKVCVWFDLEDGQKMGVPGIVTDVYEGSVTVQYMILGEIVTKVFSEGQARTHLAKID